LQLPFVISFVGVNWHEYIASAALSSKSQAMSTHVAPSGGGRRFGLMFDHAPR
jgi:hypothetical protein